MEQRKTFAERSAAPAQQLSFSEQVVIRFFLENREEVLVTSAAALAEKIGTSDATIIRASQALGYSGLDDLRRHLADELRLSLSPAARLTRTLGAVKNDIASGLGLIVDVHIQALEKLQRDINPALFEQVIELLAGADRVAVFGIGPSSALANYFAIQLGRFGIANRSLTHTGLSFADELHFLKEGDVIVALAYGRVYPEIEALLEQASRVGASTVLLTDTLGSALRDQVDLVLPVARGNIDCFSTHTGTLGLIEAMLVGVAAKRPAETVASLKKLNDLRAEVAGGLMNLPISERRHSAPRKTKRS
jgi:DNA-binding MurR/RpiR family transcriptional regulator